MKRLLLLLVVVCGLASMASAATVYVDPAISPASCGTYSIAGHNCAGSNGTAYKTVAGMTAAIACGDTAYIRAGSYAALNNEAIIYFSGKGCGSWSTPVTIAAYTGETVTLAPVAAGGNAGAIRFINSSYIQIINLVADCYAGGGTCVRMQETTHSHHIRLQGVEVKNTGRSRGNAADPACYDPCNENGLIVDGTDHEFINVSVHDNGRGGYDHGFYGCGDRCLVKDSRIYNNSGHGIQGGGCGHQIFNNSVHDNGQSGFLGAAIGAGGPGIGIYYDSCGGKVYKNLAYHNFEAGIRVQYGTNNADIRDNTTYNNGRLGLTAYGITVEEGSAVCQNNIVIEPGTPTFGCTTQTTNLESSTISAAANYFTNVAAADFRLVSTAPAVDHGTCSTGVLATDFIGVSRPQPTSGACDVGAYEYFNAGGDPSSPLYSYTFETGSGTLPANAYPNATNREVRTDVDGNHYLRMYAAGTDCGPTFNTTCPTVRSEQEIGRINWQTYSTVTASLRYRTNSTATTDNDRVTIQFFQSGGCGGCASNTGWTMKFTGVDTPNNDYTIRMKDGSGFASRPTLGLGPLSTGVWHTLTFIYALSYSVGGGSITIYVDGVNKGTLTGRTLLNQLTGQSDSTSLAGIQPVTLYLNIYDSGSLVPETLDFDDIIIRNGSWPPTGENEPSRTLVSADPFTTGATQLLSAYSSNWSIWSESGGPNGIYVDAATDVVYGSPEPAMPNVEPWGAVRTDSGYGNNHSSLLKMKAVPSAAYQQLGVGCRMSTDVNGNRDGYEFFLAGSTGTTYLVRTENGVRTTLYFDSTVPWTANDTIECDAFGTTIRGRKNGVVLTGFVVTDTALTTGKPGIVGAGNLGTLNATGDDWAGYTLDPPNGQTSPAHVGIVRSIFARRR